MFLSAEKTPAEHFPATAHGRDSLRHLVANVREYMATLSSSLEALEEGLLQYDKDTSLKKTRRW
jgi:hypothetical protein